ARRVPAPADRGPARPQARPRGAGATRRARRGDRRARAARARRAPCGRVAARRLRHPPGDVLRLHRVAGAARGAPGGAGSRPVLLAHRRVAVGRAGARDLGALALVLPRARV
ncbi:MAG: hypothetical protein AVDCRST_MAG30-1168, partial [uncultured Solirubrobacteraceae bacterium]